MSIKENLERIKNEVNGGNAALENRLVEQAVQALFAGVHSTEWKTLMKNFVDAGNTQQLARLTFDDPQSYDPEIRKNALYLAALAACGAHTIMNSNMYVNPDVLDHTLAPPPDPDPA